MFWDLADAEGLLLHPAWTASTANGARGSSAMASMARIFLSCRAFTEKSTPSLTAVPSTARLYRPRARRSGSELTRAT